MPINNKIDFLLLKGENTKGNSISTLKSLLSSDGEVSFYKKTIQVNKITVSFKVSTALVQDGGKERYFFIGLERNVDEKKEKIQIEELSNAYKKIKQIIVESGKTIKIATLFDDTEFYLILSF